MSMPIRTAVVAFAAVVLVGGVFGQVTPHQTATYSIPISGRVLDYDGAPMQNRVLVLSGSGRQSIKTQTDQDGRFRFPLVEGNKPASLQVETGIPPVDLGILKRGGDIGTVVLQPLGQTPVEHFHPTNGSTQPLLSGRITDANGAPMAGKVLIFSNRRTGFFLRMDQNGMFICPPASDNEYEVYISDSAFPFDTNTNLKYVGNIAVSDGQDIDLGNIVLQQSASAKKGNWGDIAGRVMGHIAGPVKIAPLPASPKSAVRSSVDTEGAIAGAFCGVDPAAVIHENGSVALQPKEKEQTGCSSLKISADKQSAGWLVDSDFCCTSYPIQLMLVVYRPGEPLQHFTGDGRAILQWQFVAGGKQVAFYQDFLHGTIVPHYELRDVDTGRLVAKWDGEITAKAPGWVQRLK